VKNPDEIANRLHGLGFDATSRSRMVVVPSQNQRRAAWIADNWNCILFLPWSCELNGAAIEDLGNCLVGADRIVYAAAQEMTAGHDVSKTPETVS
jgi:hypothetical protein